MTEPGTNWVQRALEPFLPPGRWCLYSEVFEELWSLDLERVRRLAGETGRVYLVWDESPYQWIEHVRVANYLSPVDWAVATALKLAGQEMPVRILLFDREAELPGTPTRFVLDMYRNGFSPLSWLDVVSMSAGDALTTAMRVAMRPAAPDSRRDAETLPHLESTWIGSLARSVNPNDHHALANLFGPELLDGVKATTPVGLRPVAALLQRLRLLPEVTVTRVTAGVLEGRQRVRFERSKWKEHVDRFVLIDDMAKTGWSEFLRSALEIEQEDQLEVHDDPQWLLELLPDGKTLKQRGGFDPDWDRRVLILDLRLFQKTGAGAERRFFIELVARARAAKGLGPLEGHLDAVLAAARDEARDLRGHPRYPVALAMFPALLAYCDPTLPIVIFSSTRQRETMALLHSFPNIITDFSKPVLDGRSHEALVAESHDAFRRAMRGAVEQCRARHVLRAASRHQPPTATQPAARDVLAAAPSGAEAKWPAAHVFIDESGDAEPGSAFVVGGVVVLAPDENDPWLADLSKEMTARNLIWGLAHGEEAMAEGETLPTFKPKPRSETDPQVSGWLAEVDECVKACGSRIIAVALQSTAVTSSTLPDAAFREMLDVLLQHLLLSVLPRYVKADGRVGIHVATRLANTPCYPLSDRRLDAASAARIYGLRADFANSKGPLFFSFAADHLYPLISEFERRFGRRFDVRPARGVQLVDFGNKLFQKRRDAWLATGRDNSHDDSEEFRAYFEPQRPRPLQIHYVADLVSRAARGILSPSLGRWFEGGFLEDFAHAREWGNAVRHAASKPHAQPRFRAGHREDVLAVECAAVAHQTRPEDDAWSVSRWSRADVAPLAVNLMKGKNELRRFRKFVARLPP